MNMGSWFWNEGWTEISISYFEAAKWKKLVGHEVLAAESWIDAGFTPETAEKWIAEGYSPMSARGTADFYS